MYKCKRRKQMARFRVFFDRVIKYAVIKAFFFYPALCQRLLKLYLYLKVAFPVPSQYLPSTFPVPS